VIVLVWVARLRLSKLRRWTWGALMGKEPHVEWLALIFELLVFWPA
jgi:hypothetical protein